MQGPENFLHMQSLAFRCPVHSNAWAVIDSTTRVEINHDIFYCSSPAAAREFRATPRRFLTTLGDPVTHARFRVSAATSRLVRHGRAYYFASTTTRRIFLAHPDSFAIRRAEPMH